MARDVDATVYKKAFVLDTIGAIAIITSTVMAFRGALPLWAQALYLVGCLLGGASTFLQRNYFSVVCFLIAGVISAYQLVGAA